MLFSLNKFAPAKRLLSGLVAVGFVAAAAFLVDSLWFTPSAAAQEGVAESNPGLLLALDTPRAPAPKVKLDAEQLASVDPSEAIGDSMDLASELNHWSFTASQSQILGQQLLLELIAVDPNARAFFGELFFIELLFPKTIPGINSFIIGTENLLVALFFPGVPISPAR